MSGYPSEPLSTREVERYAGSSVHVYHRGQSFREYEYKAEEVRALFPQYRIIFVFPWQSSQNKQNFFVVFPSPEAAVEAREHHKAQAWSVEPVDKHKASKLIDLLRRVEVPKVHRNRLPPNGPAARYGSSSTPTPPRPSPSPSTSNVNPRYYDGPPPEWTSTSHPRPKRSAHDAFNSPEDLEYPPKRRPRAASSIDTPLDVSTGTYQSDPSSSCPSWALEEIKKLRIELAHLKDNHATAYTEPETHTSTSTPHPETSSPLPVQEPVPGQSTPDNAPAGTQSAETREVGIATDGENLFAESDAIINDLQQQLDSERQARLSLESELREARESSERLSKSETELRKHHQRMMENFRQVEIHRGQFDALLVEREQLQAKIRTLEASVSASLAQPRSLPSAEDVQTMRGALVAETTRRVNAERARDEARAAKSDLEARIPAVVQLYRELEGIAARGIQPRVLAT
ncbi:hypothetical protein FRC01_008861 [Tulasnella sp. 417]|nr:hypothetical protein FRC01_008861 [Tulasnella sp. 417]